MLFGSIATGYNKSKLNWGESAMQVFISYASKDEALAQRVVESLEAAGLDAWWEKREICLATTGARRLLKA